jgi:DASS family divalent anion:Na+ symporter
MPWKLGVVLAVPILVLITPVPAGLSADAWHVLAVYLGAILGIMLRPAPEPVVLLAAISVSSLALGNVSSLLSGYASTTAWLVFAAFLVGQVFVDTGLGRRIAYLLLSRTGRSTLGLGYAAAFTDFILSPATASNTARTGGIVYPIFRSIAVSVDAEAGPVARPVGAYLTILLYQVSLTTGFIFMTAIAPNALSVAIGRDILQVDVSWLLWAKAAIVPGLVVLLLLPYLVYRLCPPDVTHVNNVEIAARGLRELGPISARERRLALLFVLAITGWATSGITHLDASAVAIAFVGACLVGGVTTWDRLVASKAAWGPFIWYGGIIGLAETLARAQFFAWLANVLRQRVSLEGVNPTLVLIVLLFLGLAVRYLFASMAAYVASFVPVLFALGLALKAPVMPLFFLVALSASFGSLLTHYGGALGPVLFATGYVDQLMWWKVGAVVVLMSAAVCVLVGLPYWKLIGLW